MESLIHAMENDLESWQSIGDTVARFGGTGCDLRVKNSIQQYHIRVRH